MSVETQTVDRSLALALWNDLCREIESECRGVNSVDGRRMIFERKPLEISVTDTDTRKLLRLAYQETGPFINYRETGKPDAKISFRVEGASRPSLTLTYCGIPQSTQALAVNLMIGLTRF
jgi:hypothetical protein